MKNLKLRFKKIISIVIICTFIIGTYNLNVNAHEKLHIANIKNKIHKYKNFMLNKNEDKEYEDAMNYVNGMKVIASTEGTTDVEKRLSTIKIYNIQGASLKSQYEGQFISNIEGIVTATEKNMFYMQDQRGDNNPRTSDAIVVYSPSHNVKVGDLVYVDGKIEERGFKNELTITQIKAAKINIDRHNQALPPPVKIGYGGRLIPDKYIDVDIDDFNIVRDALDFYESLESMRIQISNPSSVGPTSRFNELSVIVKNKKGKIRTEHGGILLTEKSFNPEVLHLKKPLTNEKYPEVKTGDSFKGDIVGILSYDYGNFIIRNTSPLPVLIDGGSYRESTTLKSDNNKLTIATYNIENYGGDEGVKGDKTIKLAKSVVKNMQMPDIIGLVEVQDNDGDKDSGISDASKTLMNLIKAIENEGGITYNYVSIAPVNNDDGGAPGGNIQTAFLYNSKKLNLVKAPHGDAITPVKLVGEGSNTKLTLNPGRIDPQNLVFKETRKPLVAQFEFRGQNIFAIVNHPNSKRRDDPLFGKIQPPVFNTEPRRVAIAAAINSFVKDIISKDPKANIILMGDMNDFEFSKSVKTLAGSELTIMTNSLADSKRYSYVYNGSSQALDHILVSNSLSINTLADAIHINSDFTEVNGRASDHDPVMIQINFNQNK